MKKNSVTKGLRMLGVVIFIVVISLFINGEISKTDKNQPVYKNKIYNTKDISEEMNENKITKEQNTKQEDIKLEDKEVKVDLETKVNDISEEVEVKKPNTSEDEGVKISSSISKSTDEPKFEPKPIVEPKPKEETKSELKPETKVEPQSKPEPKYKEEDTSGIRYATASLNMRSGPGTDYNVLSNIPYNGETTLLKKVDNGWYKAAFNNKNGYVSGKYLSTTKAKPKPAPQPTKYAPMKMYLPNKTLTYKNGGKTSGSSIIDSNHGLISTWGGANPFSGNDGMNTHFIGHNTKAFKGIWNYTIGSKIIITDSKGNPTTYKITEKFRVDDYGVNVSNGKELFNYIAGSGGGEVITLQTCQTSDINWILRAVKVN